MIVASQLFDSNTSTLDQSVRALDAVNFFVGGTLAGFGPFVALFLGGQGWSPENVGFVLTIGGIASLLAQIPGGELLDAPGRRGSCSAWQSFPWGSAPS
jgi:hypothetical protein